MKINMKEREIGNKDPVSNGIQLSTGMASTVNPLP